MKADRVMLHIRLPRKLAARMKAEAERKGQSVTKYVERALERALGLRRTP